MPGYCDLVYASDFERVRVCRTPKVFFLPLLNGGSKGDRRRASPPQTGNGSALLIIGVSTISCEDLAAYKFRTRYCGRTPWSYIRRGLFRKRDLSSLIGLLGGWLITTSKDFGWKSTMIQTRRVLTHPATRPAPNNAEKLFQDVTLASCTAAPAMRPRPCRMSGVHSQS